MTSDLLRSLPSIERLLTRPTALRLSERIGRNRVRDMLRDLLEELRVEINSDSRNGSGTNEHLLGEPSNVDSESLANEIERRLEARAVLSSLASLRRVINATGVLIHTNLGRAPLARQAIEAMAEVAGHYSNLEYDLTRGQRGHRDSHCQELLARLTGAEAAVIANNNAAAIMLVLNTLAEGGEVIVSRGELIEIGGSFRIPDVLEKSGARLVEVGTTNRTRISDYERALSERTRLILRVHPSNYRIIGFTSRPTVEEIADFATRRGVHSFEDLGSGCLTDVARFGVKDEPVVSSSLRAGISVVSFSGDKMMGGPQAGIIAGTRVIVDRVRRNPLMRALRADKLTYAAIDATLKLYERGVAQSEVPVIRAMAATREELAARAEHFCQELAERGLDALEAAIEDGESVVGGGSAPEVKLPTVLVAIRDSKLSAASLEEKLRANTVPIITRTERDRVLIDLRTVTPEEEPIILDALRLTAQPTPVVAASGEGRGSAG